MKNFIFIFFIFSSICFSDEIISIVKLGPGLVENYADAVSLAKDTNSEVFIYFGADWCPYCKSMKKNTLEDSGVENQLFKKFIVLNIDVDENKKIKEKYKVKSLPDCVIIDRDENILKRSSGVQSKEKFLKWIE